MWEGWWAVPRQRDQMQANMSQMLLIATPEPSSEELKNTFAGLWGTVVWVVGAPDPKQYFLALCSSIITILGIQNHFCWPVGYNGMVVWGATPEPKHYGLALCSSNTIIRGTEKHLC